MWLLLFAATSSGADFSLMLSGHPFGSVLDEGALPTGYKDWFQLQLATFRISSLPVVSRVTKKKVT